MGQAHHIAAFLAISLGEEQSYLLSNAVKASAPCEDCNCLHEDGVRSRGEEYWIYCFSKREDPGDFCKRFGGELMDRIDVFAGKGCPFGSWRRSARLKHVRR